MSKHTPGPWQVNHSNPFQVCDADGDIRGCAPIATMRGTAAEKRANARLISAAPDLLAALATIMAGVAGIQRDPKWEAARAAIAKAIPAE